MESLPKKEVSRTRRAVLPLLAASLLLAAAGCVTTDAFVHEERAPTGAPCHLVVNWKKQVYFTADPTRGGAPMPGLVGRLYLFDKKVSNPIGAPGGLIVDLYDCSQATGGRQPVQIEQWRFDKDTLARLLVKDGIGWGYTLFLPWGSIRPDLRALQFRVRFEPEGGTPLYAEICHVHLQDELAPVVTQTTAAGSALPKAAPPGTALPMPRTAEPQVAPRTAEPPRTQSFNLARPADAEAEKTGR